MSGPAAADTLFHADARARFDAALCMYHDQALIPIKTLAFDEGVNVTLGLPFVRTSPDHGTAFDIAGQGVADASSLIEAVRMARSLGPKGTLDSAAAQFFKQQDAVTVRQPEVGKHDVVIFQH